MSTETYTVLQVMYSPDKADAQPTKLFGLKTRTLQQALTEEVTPRVYAWRTYQKEHDDSLLGVLLASEHAFNHSPWTIVLGTLVSFEWLLEQKKISSATVQRKRDQGYVQAVIVKDDLIAYVTATDVIGPNVKRKN